MKNSFFSGLILPRPAFSSMPVSNFSPTVVGYAFRGLDKRVIKTIIPSINFCDHPREVVDAGANTNVYA